MNPYPAERSVLILDNCHIHHNDALVDLVQSAGVFFLLYKIVEVLIHDLGCLILYLPPYSPDLNPIEESFSTRKSFF